MKRTKKCPKCGSFDIIRFDGSYGNGAVGNNIIVGMSVLSAVNVNRYVCTSCGFIEEWVDDNDISKLVKSKNAKRIN